MKQTNIIMLAIFVALGSNLIAGLLVMSTVHEAQARETSHHIKNSIVGEDNEAKGFNDQSHHIKNSIVGKDNEAAG